MHYLTCKINDTGLPALVKSSGVDEPLAMMTVPFSLLLGLVERLYRL